MTVATLDHDDGLPTPRRYFAIAGILMAIIMAVLDGAIVNIALPTIAEEFDITASKSVWVVNAYQLAVTMSILPAAALGEIFGYKKFYILGLTVFVCSALIAALSRSFEMLTIARVMQGMGAACVMAINGSVLRYTYPTHLLGAGLGLNSTCVAIATTGGPIVAGAILAVASWPWLFAINVPFGLMAVLLLWNSMPPTPPRPGRFDVISGLLNALTFGLLVFAVGSAGHGQPVFLTVIELAGALTAAILLVRRETGRRYPMLPLDLLRHRLFALSCGTSIFSFAAQGLAFVSLPFFFHNVLGRPVVEVGALLAAWPLSLAVSAPIAGRLADRFPAAILGAGGLCGVALGLVLVAQIDAQDPAWAIVVGLAICGFGFGFFQTPNGRTMLMVGPKTRSGPAGAMISTARLLGQSLGAALAAMVFSLGGAPSSVALYAGACFALCGAAVSLSRLTAKTPPAG